jgi:hypothetical protein
MKRVLAFLLLTLSTLALAQAPVIKSGSTVYIEPANGFGDFLTTAMIDYNVPLAVVVDKDKADYIIRSSSQQIQQAGWTSSYTYVSAAFSVIDSRTSQIVFAGSTLKNYNPQAAAHKCVEQIAKYMKKHKK